MLYDFLYRHPVVALLVMVLSGLTVGTLTLNIFNLLSANWELISQYGLMALRDGAAIQLLELSVTGTLSMLVYLVFKISESTLLDWLKDRSTLRKSSLIAQQDSSD